MYEKGKPRFTFSLWSDNPDLSYIYIRLLIFFIGYKNTIYEITKA